MTLTAPPRPSVHVTGGMHALVFCAVGRPLEQIAVPEVQLHAGEALVEIELATICGSDVHSATGHRRVETPQVLGHEQVGRVVALGPGAAPRTVDGREVRVGMRVVWGVAIDCGRCRYCKGGLPQKCASLRKYGHERMARGWELSGGFASHAHLLARTAIVEVGDELPAAVLAPASCATATVMAAFAAAEQVRPLPGTVVAISGCGMLGLTAIAIAVARGATVVASDTDAGRRAAAIAMGASATADGSPDSLQAALRRVAGGRHGFGIALELSGAPAAVQGLLTAADLGAALVLVGSVFPAGSVPLDPETVVRRMLTVRGVHNYAPQHLLAAVDFLRAADHAALAALVGDTLPLTAVDAALTEAASGRHVRVGLQPQRTPIAVAP